MTMKKTSFVFIAALLLLCTVCLSACTDKYEGYAESILDARAAEKPLYEACDQYFTIQGREVFYDILLDGDSFHLLTILSAKKNTLFSLYSCKTYSIKEQYALSKTSGGYGWTVSAKDEPKQYQYCIVTKEYNESHDCYFAFEFSYEDELLHFIFQPVWKD